MTIWTYKDTHPDPIALEVDRLACLFCEKRLELVEDRALIGEFRGSIRACSTCGWWCKHTCKLSPCDDRGLKQYTVTGACAQLRKLCLADVSASIENIRQYLLARYDHRFEVHPKIFEDVVAAVFRDSGYVAEVTAYQGDGGIDVVLRTPTNETIGVQVKRYKDRIEVEQIRAFAGALLLNDHPSGIFVTTSSYQSGAYDAARGFAARGLPIELLDADRFYDALKITRRPMYTDYDDWYREIEDIKEHVLYEDEGPFL